MARPKKKKEEEVVEDTKEDLPPIVFNFPSPGSDKPKMRFISLYGDINETKASDLLLSMFVLREQGKIERLEDPDDVESDIITEFEPFELYVSSHGGSATEMFSLYDTMRMIQRDCEIHTFGVGKVMSASVLLLAAGTKGKRKIGSNCRVMIHGVHTGQHGDLFDLENEMEEAKNTQKQYVKCLAAETNMTEKYLRNLIKRKTNVYLDAQQAVELGIADVVV